MVKQNSATSTSFGYGVGGGVVISNLVDVGVHYFTAEPKYNAQVTDGTTTGVANFTQPSGIITLTVGYFIL